MQKNLYLIFILTLIASTSCTVEKPGEGEKANKGYQVCSPIISALEDYYTKNDVYPNSLNVLFPNIDSTSTVINNYPLVYQSIDAGKNFSLMFSYTQPGMNNCTYTPKKKWNCEGYY